MYSPETICYGYNVPLNIHCDQYKVMNPASIWMLSYIFVSAEINKVVKIKYLALIPNKFLKNLCWGPNQRLRQKTVQWQEHRTWQNSKQLWNTSTKDPKTPTWGSHHKWCRMEFTKVKMQDGPDPLAFNAFLKVMYWQLNL